MKRLLTYICLLLLVSCSYTVQLDNGKTVELKKSDYERPVKVDINKVETRSEDSYFSCSYQKHVYDTWYSFSKDRFVSGWRWKTFYGERREYRVWYEETYRYLYQHKKRKSKVVKSKVLKETYYELRSHGKCH